MRSCAGPSRSASSRFPANRAGAVIAACDRTTERKSLVRITVLEGQPAGWLHELAEPTWRKSEYE